MKRIGSRKSLDYDGTSKECFMNNMKILDDSQTFEMQKFGGISRYFYMLAKYNQGLYDYALSGKYVDNVYVSELAKIDSFPIKKDFRGKGRFIRFANKRSNLKAIHGERYDVFHPTYYAPLAMPKNKPVVQHCYYENPEKRIDYTAYAS